LINAVLDEGLEEIGAREFAECTSLHEILIPHAVKAIKDRATYQCTQMITAGLGEGLEEIGEWAYQECRSQHEILIPPAVKVIKDSRNSWRGLEEIWEQAFAECTLIHEILIPHAVNPIKDGTFLGCSLLTNVAQTLSLPTWAVIFEELGTLTLRRI
jgi:hypothetical protein